MDDFAILDEQEDDKGKEEGLALAMCHLSSAYYYLLITQCII